MRLSQSSKGQKATLAHLFLCLLPGFLYFFLFTNSTRSFYECIWHSDRLFFPAFSKYFSFLLVVVAGRMFGIVRVLRHFSSNYWTKMLYIYISKIAIKHNSKVFFSCLQCIVFMLDTYQRETLLWHIKN